MMFIVWNYSRGKGKKKTENIVGSQHVKTSQWPSSKHQWSHALTIKPIPDLLCSWPSPPPPPLFPSLFSISLLFLPALSASTACKARNILKETSRGIDLRRRGELLQSNKHKLVSKAHHSPSRQTPLGWTFAAAAAARRRSDAKRQKTLPRQKRHQSLKIINERESVLNRAAV